jgi:glutathionylspermidine synthase
MTDERTYADFAAQVVASTTIVDPWYDGKPRLRAEPIVLPAHELAALYRAAEEVAAVYDELTRLVDARPELLTDFFKLTPLQQAMWMASAPQWHGVARADLFVTSDGTIACAELNCDTPTGEPEAVALNALAAAEHPQLVDPNRQLEPRFLRMVGALATAAGVDARHVGIVYPTDMTEDLALVRLYREWLERAGCQVVLGAPHNLAFRDGRLHLFDTPIGVALRHYKTDWWGERESPWRDETLADREPLREALGAALAAAAVDAAVFVNPFGSVLPQNKRAMAYMWEHRSDFSAGSRAIIDRHVPYTVRMESLHREQLEVERAQWVLKADYGAEGSEVVVGAEVDERVWAQSLAAARAGRWVAQRYFAATVDAAGEATNYGVYLVAGEAAGVYARVQRGATDERALSVPVLVGENVPPLS